MQRPNNSEFFQTYAQLCQSSRMFMNQSLTLMNTQEQIMQTFFNGNTYPNTYPNADPMRSSFAFYPTSTMNPQPREEARAPTNVSSGVLSLLSRILSRGSMGSFVIPAYEINVPLSTASSTRARGLSHQDISANCQVCKYRDVTNATNHECPISQEPFAPDDNILQITTCGHIYHRENLQQWFQIGTCCPLCRVDLRSRRHTPTNEPARETSESTLMSIVESMANDMDSTNVGDAILTNIASNLFNTTDT